jgi:putative membrane protein
MTQLPEGSDRQREHQANERTFLAWLRTSIALIGFGFAIARFGIFLRQLRATLAPEVDAPTAGTELLGLLLVLAGVGLVLFAAWHYNQVFWQIERGQYRPNRWIIWVTTGLVVILGLCSLPLMVSGLRLPSSSDSMLQSRRDRPWIAATLQHWIPLRRMPRL